MDHLDLTALPDLIDAAYDGPHSEDAVEDAARTLVSLARYLTHAAAPGQTTLRQAPRIYRLVSHLAAATGGLCQVLGQLQDAGDRIGGDPTLYDDRRDRPATATMRSLSAALDCAQADALALAGHLDEARDLASHLGHDR